MDKKVYIIEDDVNTLSGLKARLSVGGITVAVNIGAGDIKDILYEVKSIKPDFIILDLLLPAIDGFELLRALKAEPEISHTPVFVFTNLIDKDSREKSENLGADYYFIKSEFNIDGFVKKILKIIANREKMQKKDKNDVLE